MLHEESQPARVCFLDHTATVSGAEIALLALIGSLDPRRFAAVLVCPPGDLQKRARDAGIRTKEIPVPQFSFRSNPLALLAAITGLVLASIRLGAFLRTEGTAILHANSPRAGILGALAILIGPRPAPGLFWHVRDILPVGPLSVATRLLAALSASRIIAISDGVRSAFWFGRRLAHRTHVIYDGIPTERFKPSLEAGARIRREFGFQDDDLVVAIVGQIIQWKGQREFILAAGRIAAQVPNARFLIVGEAVFRTHLTRPYKTEVIELTHTLGIADRCVFTGFRDDVVDILSAVDVLVLASWAEPLGLVQIEAMAMEIPVVATDAGGAREIVLDGDTGLLVRPKDPKAIADAVLSLAASPERRRRMGVAARERARRQFDLSKHAELVQSLYEELLPAAATRAVSPPSATQRQLSSRVAIVWDHLATAGGAGGAERTLEALHEMFPAAPIYTTIYNSERMPASYRSWDIRPSFLQHMPFARTRYAPYLPLMPMAVEQFDLRPFDLVISGSFFAAKGAITRPDATHLCYCFTPSRYLWELRHEYLRLEQFNLVERALIPPLMTSLRVWDEASALRVDSYVAISSCVADRIRKHYRRDAIVVAPPVDVSRFQVDPNAVEDFYLIVGRMVSYKRTDLAIQAFNASGRPLVVIGDGVERSRLQRQAGPTIRFLGRQPDEIVASYFTRCKAFIFPAEEDFGITAVEAQAAGRPVIAFRRGGAMDTIVDGATGGFFDEQSVDALNRAIEEFDFEAFDPATARRNAERFDRPRFQSAMRAFAADALHRAGAETGVP